jgi:hypothetical protein
MRKSIRHGLQWGAAIEAWQGGDKGSVAALLRDPEVALPDFARFFLADLVEGKAKRGGRPNLRHPLVERQIVAEYFACYESARLLTRAKRGGHSPKDFALEQVAKYRSAIGRRITAESVAEIVKTHRKSNFTLENWIKWGRPDWQGPKFEGKT